MRVLHVIDALGLGGGAEHSLAGMLPHLRDRGVDSVVVCMAPRQGGLQARLLEEGFEVYVLQASSWLGRVFQLRRRIRTLSPDLVHASLPASCLVSRIACVGLRVPLLNSLVNTSYDPIRLRASVRRWKLATLQLLDGITARHLVDHFHALTRTVEREAVETLRIRPDRVTVIPRGRSAAQLGAPSADRRRRARMLLGVGDDTPLFLNVGRQDHQKAQALLIHAFSLVLRTVSDAVLVIAGREGDASEEIARAIIETDVGSAVQLLGHRIDVPELLAAADVFLLPSLYEGLGGSLIEAMALSVPIVGSDAPAIKEVLGDGELGVLVPVGDARLLADGMVRLLEDDRLREELGRKGVVEFRSRYEIGRVMNATLALYEAVLGYDGWRGSASG